MRRIARRLRGIARLLRRITLRRTGRTVALRRLTRRPVALGLTGWPISLRLTLRRVPGLLRRITRRRLSARRTSGIHRIHGSSLHARQRDAAEVTVWHAGGSHKVVEP